jgi:hypothetical protein
VVLDKDQTPSDIVVITGDRLLAEYTKYLQEECARACAVQAPALLLIFGHGRPETFDVNGLVDGLVD